MIEYEIALSVRPRPSIVAPTTVRSLLEDKGILRKGALDLLRLVEVADTAGVTPELVQLWLDGKVVCTWRDLSALALALDCHPEFAPRLLAGGAHGPWFITPNATAEYMDITVGRLDYDDARNELIEMAKETLASGRIPRKAHDGKLVYRGPKPLRLALVVAPANASSELPALVAVQPTHEGIHVTVSEEMAGGHDPVDYRNWLSGWLFKRFQIPSSTSVGPEAFAFGVDGKTLAEAQRLYREEMLGVLMRAAAGLQNAIVDWKNQRGDERNRCANLVRLAALEILQFATRHPRALQLTLDQKATLVRVSEVDAGTWHTVIATHQGDLFGFASRLRTSLEG